MLNLLDGISEFMNNKKIYDTELCIIPYEYKNIFSKKHNLFNNNEQKDCV